MEFSSNQEDIYNKLINSNKSKYGKEVQVKYELTRPRKKQKKKNLTKNHEDNPEVISEEVYSVPPDESDGESSEADESLEPPPPPPRVDSLSDNAGPHVENIPNSDSDRINEVLNEGIYAPCNWRQQNYETWTPGFMPSAKDLLPPPTQPPPKPPVMKTNSDQGSLKHQDNLQRRKESYESWTPPSQPPPKPPTQSLDPKKKFPSTPKQISGLKKIGQPTPFTNASKEPQSSDMIRPTRPAPAPPSAPTHPSTSPTPSLTSSVSVAGTPSAQPFPQIVPGFSSSQSTENSGSQTLEKETGISLSPIRDFLPTEERLYEPCNWRRQLKECEDEMYGVMEEILPPPPELPSLGGSVTLAKAPPPKVKPILKEKKADGEGDEKKKRVRMLFPIDTVTPI